jgi:hypothetical protein
MPPFGGGISFDAVVDDDDFEVRIRRKFERARASAWSS